MCWTPPYTRRRQTKQKTQHNMCWTPPYTRRRQTKQKHNALCVGHHLTQDTRRRHTKQKTQHNMCWTPPYTRHKTKTSKIQKPSTICVGHHHTQDTRRSFHLPNTSVHSPFYSDGSCCSIFCLLCSDLSTIVCLYHFFFYLSLNCLPFFDLSLLITIWYSKTFLLFFLIAEIGLDRWTPVFHLGMLETRICLTTILTTGKQIQSFITNLIMAT